MPAVELDLERTRAGIPHRESAPDGEWSVRQITARNAAKEYKCPGCGITIPPGVPHLVVWQEDSLLGRVEDETADPFLDASEDGFRASLSQAIKELPERERLVMSLYYDDELNLKEIGAVMGVSESRVSQLHTQAVARLRATLKEQLWTGQA